MAPTADPRWGALARLAREGGNVVTGIRVVTAVAAVQIYCSDVSDLSAWMVWSLHDPQPGQEYLDDLGVLEWEFTTPEATAWIERLGTEPLRLLGGRGDGRDQSWRLMMGDAVIAESARGESAEWSFEIELIPAATGDGEKREDSPHEDPRTRALAGLAVSVGLVSGLRIVTATAEVEVVCDASFQDTLTLSWWLLEGEPRAEYLAAKTLEWELDEPWTQEWIAELGIKPVTLLGVEGARFRQPFELTIGDEILSRTGRTPKSGWSVEIELIPGDRARIRQG